jgi:hypothetical protein
MVWCGVLAWWWLAGCGLRLGAEPAAPSAPGRAAIAALGAVVILLCVPAGPIDPNHHGVHLWASLTDPRDVGFLTDSKHGGAHLWLWKMAAWAGVPEPWFVLPAAAVAAGACFALGAAAAAAVGPRAGLLATALLALWPPHQRVAAGLSGVIVAELGATLVLLGVQRRGAGGPAAWTGVAFGGVALAAGARGEWVALGPLWLAVAWLALGARPTRDDLVAAAFPATLVAVRIWTFFAVRAWTFMVDPAMDLASIAEWQLAPPILAGGILTLAAALASQLGLGQLQARGAGAVALAAAGALTIAAWPNGFEGEFHAWPAWLTGTLLVQPWAHPDLTSPWWTTLSLIGFAVGLRRAPWRTALVAGWVLAATALLAIIAKYDGASTYLRAGPTTGWLLCCVAAIGADAAAPRGRLGDLLLAAGTTIGAAATWGFTTYRWPDATEYALVAHAREARGDGVIVSLLRSDLPGDTRELAADDRLFVETGLHALVLEPGPPPPLPWLRGVDQTLADPASAVGGLWLQTLACYRVVPNGPTVRRTLLFAGDRVWEATRRYPRPPAPAPPHKPPPVTVRDAACWDQLHLALPDVGPGPSRCPPTVQPSGRPYVDPRCAAIAATFTLEPLEEVVVGTGNLSGARLHVDHPAPTLGLYRITGLRAP